MTRTITLSDDERTILSRVVEGLDVNYDMQTVHRLDQRGLIHAYSGPTSRSGYELTPFGEEVYSAINADGAVTRIW